MTYIRRGREANLGLEALEAEGTPGRCLACDAPLPPSKPNWLGYPNKRRVTCDSPECRRVYHAAYGVGRRLRQGRKPRVQNG